MSRHPERLVLFRADASPTIGLGHLVRSQALAAELQSRGLIAWFAASRLPGPSPRVAASNSIEVDAGASPDDEMDSIRRAVEARRQGAVIPPRRPFEAVVLDHYRLGAEWLAAVRRLGRRRLVIDDLADRQLPCDLLLNQNLDASADGYAALVRPGTVLLLGPRFALLRAAFAEAHAAAEQRHVHVVRRVLISLGGGEQMAVARLAVEATTDALPGAAIDLVVGEGSHWPSEPRHNLAIHRGIDARAMASLMLRADLAVGAGGTTSWERCATGLPSVAIRVAANQEGLVQALATAGVAIDAGRVDALTRTRLAGLLSDLARDEAGRRAMSERGWRLVDGRGAIRVAHELEGVGLRRARAADAHRLWTWANDPETRAASFSQTQIPYRDHLDWLERTLADPSRELLIGSNGAGILGQVRFDRTTDEAEISISVAPEHRGTVGAALLRAAVRRFRRTSPGLTIRARVKEDNEASRRLFERAGFSLHASAGGVLLYRLASPLGGRRQREVIR